MPAKSICAAEYRQSRTGDVCVMVKKLLHKSPLFIYASYARLCRYAEGVTIMCALLFVILIVIIYVWAVVR